MADEQEQVARDIRGVWYQVFKLEAGSLRLATQDPAEAIADWHLKQVAELKAEAARYRDAFERAMGLLNRTPPTGYAWWHNERTELRRILKGTDDEKRT